MKTGNGVASSWIALSSASGILYVPVLVSKSLEALCTESKRQFFFIAFFASAEAAPLNSAEYAFAYAHAVAGIRVWHSFIWVWGQRYPVAVPGSCWPRLSSPVTPFSRLLWPLISYASFTCLPRHQPGASRELLRHWHSVFVNISFFSFVSSFFWSSWPYLYVLRISVCCLLLGYGPRSTVLIYSAIRPPYSGNNKFNN